MLIVMTFCIPVSIAGEIESTDDSSVVTVPDPDLESKVDLTRLTGESYPTNMPDWMKIRMPDNAGIDPQKASAKIYGSDIEIPPGMSPADFIDPSMYEAVSLDMVTDSDDQTITSNVGLRPEDAMQKSALKMTRFSPTLSVQSGPSTRQLEGNDIEVTNVQFSAISTAWAEASDHPDDPEPMPGFQSAYGCFQVGETTTVTVSVRNNGVTAASNIYVNVSLYSATTYQPMAKNPVTQTIASLGPGQSTDVQIQLTPPAADRLLVVSSANYIDDPDTSNNGISWSGFVTFLWAADFESGGIGDGGTWSGDLGTNNMWHKTNTAANQAVQEHSLQNSYYHGTDSLPSDSYGDQDSPRELISPVLQLGDITDGQDEWGELEPGYFYPYFLVSHCAFWCGSMEFEHNGGDPEYIWQVDRMFISNVTDDGGATWGSWMRGVGQGAYLYGEALQSGTPPVPHWYLYVMDFDSDGTSDALGNAIFHENITNWNNVQFQFQFQSDLDGITDVGYYFDDFIVWGIQKWTAPYRCGISEVGSTGLAVTNKDITFTTEVSNYGGALSGVPVTISVKDSNGAEVHSDSKTISSMAEPVDDPVTAEQTWIWKPTSAGDYTIEITAGDVNQDYSRTDNVQTIGVHVRDETDEILVVDDDNSGRNGGIFYIDVENYLLETLDELDKPYNVFTVTYNDTGPSETVLKEYNAVIWLTGLDNEYSSFGDEKSYRVTLKDLDVEALSGYLDSGTNNDPAMLWLDSPGMLYDYYGLTMSNVLSTDFPGEYLKLDYCDVNQTEYDNDWNVVVPGTPNPLVGVDGSDIGDGASYDTANPVPNRFIDIGGWITPKSIAGSEFYQDSSFSRHNTMSYDDGGYLVVLQVWNFPFITSMEHKKDYVTRIFEFFGEGGEHLAPVPQVGAIMPSQTKDYWYNISVVGRKDDIISLAVESKPDEWEVDLSENTKNVPGDSQEHIIVTITAPSYDKSTAEVNYNGIIKIKQTSNNLGTSKFGYINLTVGQYRHLQFWCDDTEEDVNVNESVDFTLKTKYVANGGEKYTVTYSVDNNRFQLEKASMEFSPNQEQSMKLTFSAGLREPLADLTAKITATGTVGSLVNDTSVTVHVQPYYELKLEPREDQELVYTVDPNTEFGDNIVKEFYFDVFNYGNAEDVAQISIDQGGLSLFDWSFETDEEELTIKEFKDDRPGDKDFTMTVTIPLDAEVGTYNFNVTVESEGNNEEMAQMVSIVIIRPNLKFQFVNFTYVDQDTLLDMVIDPQIGAEKGTEITITVGLSNIGTSMAENVKVWINITQQGIDEITGFEYETLTLKSSSIAEFMVFQNETVALTWTPLNDGNYIINIMVDPEGYVAEIDEGDNDQSEIFLVTKGEKDKDGSSGSGGGSPGFEIMFLLAALGVCLLLANRTTRRRRQ